MFGRRTQAKRYRVKSQTRDAEDSLCASPVLASAAGVASPFGELKVSSNMLLNPACWPPQWSLDDPVATGKDQHMLDSLVHGVGGGSSAQDYAFGDGLHDHDLKRPPSLSNSSGSSNGATPNSASPSFLGAGADFSSQMAFNSFQPRNEISELSMISYETQDLLNTINNTHWTNSTDINNLNHYPVGQLVSVAQRFANVLTKVSQASQMQGDGSIQGMGLCNTFLHKSDDYSAASTPQRHGDSMDVSTSLLILSCYISMRKLFFFVLNQLEKHINSTPDQRLMGSAYRELQLGQLPSTNDTYGKVYIAVQMILDVFQSVENLLRLPDARIDLSLRRDSLDSSQDGFMNMVRAELSQKAGQEPENGFAGANSASPFQCSFDSQLRGRVDSLKAMLRERMN